MLDMRQKQAVTKTIKLRYKKTRKADKTKILNEFVETTGYNRSYARRILGKPKRRETKKYTRKVPRKRIYDYEIFVSLKKIWMIADNICGKRLKPFLPELISVLERKREMSLKKNVKEKLLSISSATIDRMLVGARRQYKLKGRSTTKPGTLLKHSIQIRTYADWDDSRPGFFETDLVAFCGDNVRGDYVNGLNLTDVAIGWVCLEAVMGKPQSRVHKAITDARGKLLYPILGIDSDNGTEFINHELKNYCEENKITFTRIRPYKKNDNCFVEQKNYTTLRRFIGYQRYDTEVQLLIVREILKLVEPYVNFFQPVMKLKEKHRVGARVSRKYDEAKTPYRRLKESGILSLEKERELEEFYLSLNPVDLKRKIFKLQGKLGRTLRYTLIDATNT